MRHELRDTGTGTEIGKAKLKGQYTRAEDFVLEKSIFNNIFEKDIRRVFIYKKSERLAKAIHLIAPAFADSLSLRNRIDEIAIGIVDAAIVQSSAGRIALARELLALSSVLSIAQSGGLLSSMNVDLITAEAHNLLQEVAAYEEPRLFLDESPTLSHIAKQVLVRGSAERADSVRAERHVLTTADTSSAHTKSHIKDISDMSDIKLKDRRDAVLSVIKNKGSASIKDISTVVRSVSEKTIQRELLVLIETGLVRKSGERRWSTYSLI